MSYKCTECNEKFIDDFSEIKENKCKKCNKDNSLKQIDCIYCEGSEKGESTHFNCEECYVGMCDNCYDLEVEHDSHFHEICSSGYDLDEGYNEQCEKLKSHFGDYPAYICEKCLSKIVNK